MVLDHNIGIQMNQKELTKGGGGGRSSLDRYMISTPIKKIRHVGHYTKVIKIVQSRFDQSVLNNK